ncbi:hypothetical protein CsSME_00031185 [Camellia sinensis var. sinensis]
MSKKPSSLKEPENCVLVAVTFLLPMSLEYEQHWRGTGILENRLLLGNSLEVKASEKPLMRLHMAMNGHRCADHLQMLHSLLLSRTTLVMARRMCRGLGPHVRERAACAGSEAAHADFRGKLGQHTAIYAGAGRAARAGLGAARAGHVPHMRDDWQSEIPVFISLFWLNVSL